MSLDRLFQDRNAAESLVNGIGLVSSDEDKWNATRNYDIGDGVSHPITEIDIKDGCVVIDAQRPRSVTTLGAFIADLQAANRVELIRHSFERASARARRPFAYGWRRHLHLREWITCVGGGRAWSASHQIPPFTDCPGSVPTTGVECCGAVWRQCGVYRRQVNGFSLHGAHTELHGSVKSAPQGHRGRSHTVAATARLRMSAAPKPSSFQ
jgi:hypothetical protein